MSFADKLQSIKFTTYLGIISIIGYGAILSKNAFGVDLEIIAEGLLFLIIGFALFVAGGYHLVFGYFKGGLTAGEITKIVTVLIGISSMFVGILTMLNIDLSNFSTVRIIISVLAIVVILLEMVANRC